MCSTVYMHAEQIIFLLRSFLYDIDDNDYFKFEEAINNGLSGLFSLAPAIQLLRPRTDLSIVVVITRTTRDYYYIILQTAAMIIRHVI